MLMHDRLVLDGVRRTADGYLAADARIARTGIQIYAGREVGRPDLDTVRVYRPEAEVFSSDTMRSAAWRPMTNDHPPENVTADNWRRYSVGQTGDEIVRDGNSIRVPLVLMDAAAIRAYDAGKRELSAGYVCELTFQDGVTPQGEAYDAVQSNIRLNHLALVDAGRAGPDHRIGDQGADDANHTPAPIHDRGGHHMALKNILVDGLMVETTDAGEAAINKLKGLLSDSAKALETANAEHAKAIAAKDGDLGKKDAEIEALKAKVVDGAALDALATERSEIVGRAKQIAKDAKFDGLSLADVRRTAVSAKLGADRVKDKSDDYVAALFDNLAVDTGRTGGDQLREVISDSTAVTDAGAALQKAKDARLAHLHTAHNQSAAA